MHPKEVVQRYSSHKMQQSKLTVTAADKWQICSLPPLLFLAPTICFVWVLILQLMSAAKTEVSSFCHFSKFKWFKEITDQPQSRYKKEESATGSWEEGTSPPLSGSGKPLHQLISSTTVCWARPTNIRSKASYSVPSTLLPSLPSSLFLWWLHP